MGIQLMMSAFPWPGCTHPILVWCTILDTVACNCVWLPLYLTLATYTLDHPLTLAKAVTDVCTVVVHQRNYYLAVDLSVN